ncbi:hypothetical protein B9T33_04265 [Acinetobacter sp. ANC 5054]|uniref:DUF3426 domain-containing protein n=1 Tax=Acinetobacter sp. ANC 5054 TaxID=1977877 RepID=UPI000A34C837|nr:DUF3426 domain-containing protein [Acinetobacter sp. ANC 5054]OTG82670.1 hypothetical protein B9T33_04265 [Acinetobacter sp. ANC 5054]
MSDKLTNCPTCSSTYKVTVPQLTVAQGMVCCPKCSTSFNALSHLVVEKALSFSTPNTQDAEKKQPATIHVNEFNIQQPISNSDTEEATHPLLKLFDQKVENSNIDLRTYLNNLNYFSTEPIGNLPAVNWAEQAEKEKKRSTLNYLMWISVNFLLFGALIFQFFWFNPQYLKSSPVMGAAFTKVCDVFNCSRLEEHYSLISTKKVKARSTGKKETKFSGEMINHHDRSLALPLLKVSLKENGTEIATYQLQPEEYLDKTLNGIQRIPKSSPFKFEFVLPIDRKSFDNYSIELIRP